MEREVDTPDIASSVAATTARLGLLPEGAPVVVLVSGGGDSVALLHLLAAGPLRRRPLRVLHVNHLLRAEESDADERFVLSLCADLGVECRVARHDVAEWAAEERLNLEDAGRQIRYRFAEVECDALCDENGAVRALGRIAVAHTRDDRIETFVMRLASGAGAGALSSIAAARGRIVRPLIETDRAAVRAYLADNGLKWREDSSNSDLTRMRAYVRENVMPAMDHLNPAFRANAARSLDLLADDDGLLGGMADAFVRDFCRVRPGRSVEFDRDLMGTLDRVMARRTVRAAVLGAFPEVSRLEARHVERLVDALDEDGCRFDLTGGLEVTCEYATLVVSRAGEELPRVVPGLLLLPGNVDLGPGGTLSAQPAEGSDTSGSPDSVVIDADKLGGELVVDSVRDGDRMQPLGMAGRRKLSDMLIDEKVPRRARGAVPVVRDGEHVVWLAGVRMGEAFRVSDSTSRAYRLTWGRPDATGEEDDEQDWRLTT